jgi:lysyl-tRNA synthetase class 2
MHAWTKESTVLAAIAYDPGRKLLELTFRTNSVYHYFGVPHETFEALLQAPSKGSYFNQQIRSRFSYQRVNQPTASTGNPRSS